MEKSSKKEIFVKQNSNTSATQARCGSHFLSGLLKAKDVFLAGGFFKVQSWGQVRFWEDNWLGNKPLILDRSGTRGKKNLKADRYRSHNNLLNGTHG